MTIKGTSLHYPPNTAFTYIATETNAPYPGYLTPTTGSVFSNKIIRVSDYPSVIAEEPYPKTQAWNIDGTLLMLYYKLLDGKTYQTIASNIWWDDDERKWSAVYPHIYYAMEHYIDTNGDGTNDHSFVKRDVTPVLSGSSTPLKEVLISFTNNLYDELLLGKYEGNIDHQDKYVVFAAKKKNTNYLTAIVFDIQNKQITAQADFTNITWTDSNGYQVLDWISVSPSGNYILIDWKKDPDNPDPVFRYSIDQYDINLNFIRELAAQGEHGDIGVDTNGTDTFIQFEFGSRAGIWAYNLATGGETRLLPSKYNGGHISCRNYKRPGWCYPSTNKEGFKEVFALKLDGSGIVNRFAQTHITDPNSEGGVSPDGTKMIFKSSWGGATSNGTDETFVVEPYK